jgi:hypothetical protein
MLSDLSGIVQALAILVGAILGVIGTLYKRDEAPLARSDKVAVIGIVLTCVLALTVLGIDEVEKARENKAELSRIADEVARQHQLLVNVQRGLLSIKEFQVAVEFTLSATDPRLAALVRRWDAYINEATPSQFDNLGYTLDHPPVVAEWRSAMARTPVSSLPTRNAPVLPMALA